MGYMTKALDTVRKRENCVLHAHGDKALVGSKYLWLYSEENLPERHHERFAALRNADLKTARAWAIKENLRPVASGPTSRSSADAVARCRRTCPDLRCRWWRGLRRAWVPGLDCRGRPPQDQPASSTSTSADRSRPRTSVTPVRPSATSISLRRMRSTWVTPFSPRAATA